MFIALATAVAFGGIYSGERVRRRAGKAAEAAAVTEGAAEAATGEAEAAEAMTGEAEAGASETEAAAGNAEAEAAENAEAAGIAEAESETETKEGVMRREYCRVAGTEEGSFTLRNTVNEVYRIDSSYLGDMKEGDLALLIYTSRAQGADGIFTAEVYAVYPSDNTLERPAK